MRTSLPLACLWPGLARAWCSGQWSGLATAAAFAGLLVLALSATFLWPARWGAGGIASVWALVAAFWIVGVWRAAKHLRERPANDFAAPQVDLFIQAQTEYLKGNWFEAESLLQRLLDENNRDVDAQMMLAALFRHTGRSCDAHRLLARLERIDGAEKWRLEIEDERQRLERIQQDQQETTTDAPPGVSEAA